MKGKGMSTDAERLCKAIEAAESLVFLARSADDSRLWDEVGYSIQAKHVQALLTALAAATAVVDDVLMKGENDGSYNADVIQETIGRLSALASRVPQPDQEDDVLCCPRCGGDTTEEELTYSGCASCQREAAESDTPQPDPKEDT